MVTLTSRQLRDLDQLCATRLGIDTAWLMELAGWQTASLARRLALKQGRVAVACGKGNNGGDGLVAARHLFRWDLLDRVWLSCKPQELGPMATRHLRCLEAMGVTLEVGPPWHQPEAAIVVDAILGIGVSRPPTGTVGALIEWVNHSGLPVLALDVPSGLDSDSGAVFTPAVKASWTITLGAVKVGLASPHEHVGELYLADIGLPPTAFAALGLSPPEQLSSSELVSLR